MRKTLILITIAAFSATSAAFEMSTRDSHDVMSTNGKFKLHVDSETELHKVSGAFESWSSGWQFRHGISNHRFFVSDDGEAVAVVHWSWVQDYRLDESAVVIYGRDGAKRTYSFRELSKPSKPKPDTIGPVGDFWRIWRDEASIKGNALTIEVAGGKPRVIDLRNPQPVPPLEGGEANEGEKKPSGGGTDSPSGP